jgi:hypothetical protein
VPETDSCFSLALTADGTLFGVWQCHLICLVLDVQSTIVRSFDFLFSGDDLPSSHDPATALQYLSSNLPHSFESSMHFGRALHRDSASFYCPKDPCHFSIGMGAADPGTARSAIVPPDFVHDVVLMMGLLLLLWLAFRSDSENDENFWLGSVMLLNSEGSDWNLDFFPDVFHHFAVGKHCGLSRSLIPEAY